MKVGLCATCQHKQIIKSARGSFFIMCSLAKTDDRFDKYPALPVVRCAGYEPEPAEKKQ